MVSNKSVTVTAIVIMALVIGIYLPLALQSPTRTSSSSASSTTSTVSTTTTTTASSTTTTITTFSSSSSEANGSFSYLPTYPVKIDSVDAVTTKNQDGTEHVTFTVTFENTSPVPIYVTGGCGSGLDSSIQTNPVIQKTLGGPLCACAQLMIPINQGQDRTSTTPGCWSGYNYALNQPGSVSVNLTLHWSLDAQNFNGTNSTSISARFTFA